jgi:hypothetical protein
MSDSHPQLARIDKSVFRVLMGAAVLVVLGLVLPRVASAGTPEYPCDNERLGFGVTKGIQFYDVTPLKAGWYVNWGTSPVASHPGGMDYAQLIRTSNSGYSPRGPQLADIVRRNPGSVWLIGNEPDSPYQDNTLPENYARVYHDAYLAIKSLDPFARIAAGGIVQATPLRLQWLDRAYAAYSTQYGHAMPVDLWHIHTFVLREVRPGYGPQCKPPHAQESGSWGADIPPGLTANCGMWVEINELDRMDLLQEQVVRFRTWMRDRGYQNQPLFVSEYGILFNAELGYGYDRVRNYMLSTFDYFRTARDPSLGYALDDFRLVQRWSWYSLDDDNFVWGTTYGALANPATRQLNPLGLEFASYASPLACSYVDLQPLAFRISTPTPIRYGQNGTVRIEVDIRNQGTASAGPHLVSFYRGNPDSGGILLGRAPVSGVPPRYTGQATASISFTTLAVGSHAIYAILDSAGQVSESREDNNRASLAVDFGAVNLTVGQGAVSVERGPLRPGESTQLRLSSVPVTATQPSQPTAGVSVLPPTFEATWYDGNPDAGGTVIASETSTPSSFGQSVTIPAQTWSPVITAPKNAWLVVAIQGGVPETTTADNRTSVAIGATIDLTLLEVAKVGGNPVAVPGEPATATLRFRVANLGAIAPSSTPIVSVRLGASGTGVEIGRVALPASGSLTAALVWPDLQVGAYPFTATVDPDNVFTELLETNNSISGTVIVARARYAMPLGMKR